MTDSSGGVVPGAIVTLTNIATNVSKTLTTNEAGVYSVTSLIPGSYRVEAAIAGFKTAVVDPVMLEVNATRKVDLTLEVGQTAEQVNVRSEAPLLQAEQTSMGQTVTEQQIEQLPTGRNLFSLIPLSAGVSQQAGCEGCGNNGNLRINGDRPRNQDYVLDGTTITAPVFGGQAINPAIDSIQEFRIEANSMSAEYGKAGGGVLVAVTKSGTNQFHGSGLRVRAQRAAERAQFLRGSLQSQESVQPARVRRHYRRPGAEEQAVLLHRLPGRSGRMAAAPSPASSCPTMRSGAATCRASALPASMPRGSAVM